MEKKKNHTTAGSDRPKDICVPTQDAESFQGRTIKLSIDESTDTEIPQVLFVHERILCSSSRFFKDAAQSARSN
ncbi:hypothetical protein PMIN06_012880 [Paraphaeosphaeria minitans]